MGLALFNTHQYVKRLQLAGFSEEQAEAQVDLQIEVFASMLYEKIFTKEEFANFAHTQEQKLNQMVTKGEFANFAHTQEQKFNKVDVELTAIRDQMVTKETFLQFEHVQEQKFIRIEGKFTLLNWMMTFLLAGTTTILFKILPHDYSASASTVNHSVKTQKSTVISAA